MGFIMYLLYYCIKVSLLLILLIILLLIDSENYEDSTSSMYISSYNKVLRKK
jgi:nitrogen fixation-related uncharacterized protein